MARPFRDPILVVASHNAGKVREIGEVLEPFGTRLFSAGEMNLPEPVEDGETFRANAEIKALAATTTAALPALADDSGLVVPAIGGRPGIHSARWAGETKDFQLAMEKVEAELAGNADRSAYFACALTLAWPDGHIETFEGRVDGRLVWPPRGERGFGYDPMFVPDGYDITFGEFNPTDKHAISHRADAFRQLVAACLG